MKEALNGFTKQIKLPDGIEVEVSNCKITQNGDKIRIKGKGFAGFERTDAGDFVMVAKVVLREEDQAMLK